MLTCCAISDGNKLCYEWYCSDSSEIISNDCCAQIKLKRPSKNMEKQYFCKIFIADQLKCCVKSEKAKVKLEIVWITEPNLRHLTLVVCTGKKLELLCKAKAAPGLKKEYRWFRCQKDAYRSQKKRIESKGNEMTIAECTDTKGGHYLCEVAAIDEQRNHIWSINAVFHVKVVNSTKITIIKQPPHEMLVTLGVEFTLECEALCGHHPIKYQWCHKTKPVADATQSMLTIKSVSEEDIGSYWCVITSNYCETRAVSRVTDVRENYSTSSDQSRCTQREDTVSLMESVEEVGYSLPETSFSGSWNQLQYEVYSSSCGQSQHDQLEAEKHLTHKNRRYAKDKMALLIGNSGYETEPLRCAKNDVKAIKEKLEQRNFRTTLLVDLTLFQMINAVEYFCSLLDKGMYAIFYYSGHGVEINKTTYFVPVDADEKNINPTQYTNSDLIGYKLQSTLAKVIMILDCCRKTFPEELQIPPVPFSGNLSIANICKIYACISSFEAVEMNNDDNSLMAMALLRSLDCSEKGQTFYDLCKCIEKYYHEHNVSTQSGKSFIRAETVKRLQLDFSVDDPVLSSSMSKARDLLLAIPEKYYLKFNHPVMERNYGESVSLHFKAVYSNVVTLHIYCDVAEGPILRDMKLSCNSGLSVVKLKSEGIASYEISNLLVLMDLAGSYPKLQFTFQMPHDENTTDLIEYKIPSDLIRLK